MVLKAIKKMIPQGLKNKILSALINPPYLGDRYVCPLCNTHLIDFNPLDKSLLELLDKHGYIHNIFQGETMNLVNYGCPACNANDRDRLYAIYMNKVFKDTDTSEKYKFIDFAPTPTLSGFIKKHDFLNYRSADLYAEGVDDVVDLMDMKIYEDNSVDMFLCSHILEHVDDDRKAMRELYRILKKGGWGIAMVPILLNLNEVYEDPSITSPEDRWKHFGQDDHCRMYSKNGFIERLEEAGFKVNQLGREYFGEETFDLHGIHQRSVLYIVEKI